MKITVVIVTYSERFSFLKEVLDSCLSLDINKIVIVDNNSCIDSKKKLKGYISKFNNKIYVIWNKTNLGSAKAYSQGLQMAKKINSEYIWMLDDDNQPRANSLKVLIDFWKNKPKEVSALLSYRPDREQYKQAVIQKEPNIVLSTKNSFSGFHVKDKVLKIFKRKSQIFNDLREGEIAYAPYGGMFFQSSLLDIIGYPNEEFFLYSDDHDWSYRITERKMKIFLVLDSVVDDIDTSWAIKDKKSSVFKKIRNAPPLRIYYSIRNRMVFEKKYLITNKTVYCFNMILFVIILGIYAFNKKNYKVFLKAIDDANNNRFVKFI